MSNTIYNFALIGAAGYIAPRHMKAIKETGHRLIAILDKFDAVGVIDNYFPEADFFIEPERFDRHLDKLRRKNENKIDYVSICSPNFLHDAHIRLALRNQAHAICEKPLVLNPWNLDALAEIEKESGKKIFTILQLRLHPSIIKLKQQVENNKNKIYDIELTYITCRGKWYYWSWKGDVTKSGGITTNIGIHFFDMLTWIFGNVRKNVVYYNNQLDTASGFLELDNANVRWFLSIKEEYLPDEIKNKCQKTYRSLTLNGEEFEFSEGFTDLHTKSYIEILNNNGFSIDDARKSIELVYHIRNANMSTLKNDYHPFVKKIKS